VDGPVLTSTTSLFGDMVVIASVVDDKPSSMNVVGWSTALADVLAGSD